MRRPTATTVSAERMKAPRSSSSSCTDLSAASALARASRLAQGRGRSPRSGEPSTPGEPGGAGARQLTPLRRLVDVGGPERVRLDAGLVEQRQAPRRTGGENECGAAEHQVIWGMKQGVNCARNLSDGG